MIVGIFDPRILFGRTFQLHQNKRQTVDKQNDVRAAIVTVFDVGILIHYRKLVIFDLFKIHKTDKSRTRLAVCGIVDFHSILQIFCKGAVLFNQTAAVEIADFGECLTDSLQRQAAIDANQSVTQNAIHKRIGKVLPPHLWRVDMRVAHAFKQLYYGIFICRFGEHTMPPVQYRISTIFFQIVVVNLQ